MKIYNILTLAISFFSCQSSSEKLFWINESTEHRNDFLSIAESTNILPINPDSIRLFLNWNEIEESKHLESRIYTNDTVLPKPVIYKNLGEIYKSDKFKLHIILRDGNKIDARDYKIILRTYSQDWSIIDSYELAVWNERDKKFCFGSINRKLIIEKRCENSKQPENMQILENGNIVLTSFQKL